MIDMTAVESARATIEERRKAALDAEIAEEVANIEHRRAMAETARQMSASVEHNRQQRIAVHGAAVLEARAALDSLKALTSAREACESKLGFSRADLEAAQKTAARCVAPSPDSYPLPSELDAWKQRHAGLDEAVRRIAARIGVESAELDRARVAELDALNKFKACERIEWERRSDL
jgi:hypothetical protein